MHITPSSSLALYSHACARTRTHTHTQHTQQTQNTQHVCVFVCVRACVCASVCACVCTSDHVYIMHLTTRVFFECIQKETTYFSPGSRDFVFLCVCCLYLLSAGSRDFVCVCVCVCCLYLLFAGSRDFFVLCVCVFSLLTFRRLARLPSSLKK